MNQVKELQKEIRDMKTESKAYLAYKQIMLTCAKSKYEPIEIINGLKFTAELIKAKKWDMIARVGSTSGDLAARGICTKCNINLVGKTLRPRTFTFPCGIVDCPFEDDKKEKND